MSPCILFEISSYRFNPQKITEDKKYDDNFECVTSILEDNTHKHKG